MDDRQDNPLISTKPSDSGLHVFLHPLVLLTISDYVTRYAARQQQGPIVGALLGQQESRQISLEYAFECHTTKGNNDEILLHPTWFADRLQQFKDVHKSPPLDLVGWFTITPPSGPSPSQLGIHRQILKDYNESAVFLGFHPSQLGQDTGSGAKLPLTIYESIYEGENVIDADADRAMQLDGEEQGVHIRFRELPYSIETSDVEMIGVDFVARGGGNAMAIKESPESAKAISEEAEAAGKKRKLKQNLSDETDEEVSAALSPEDEDVIASLSTRLNAVKTLESRIHLIRSFLESFQSASLDNKTVGQKEGMTSINAYPILRNISALISDLSLLTPQDKNAFAMETLAQKNDVTLLSLLGQLGENVKRIREVGKKSMIAESGKQGATAGGRKAHLAMQSRFDDDRDNVFANIGAGGYQMM